MISLRFHFLSLLTIPVHNEGPFALSQFLRQAKWVTAKLSAGALLIMLCPHAFAQIDEVSNAEVAAIAQQQMVRAQKTIKLCNHTLIYGSEEAKADLLAALGGASCEQVLGSEESATP